MQPVGSNVTATAMNGTEIEGSSPIVSEVASLAVIFLTALAGNACVLLALYGHRNRKLTRMHFFILHLTVADLVTAVLSVMPQLLWKVTYRFAGGATLCKVVKVGQALGPYLMAYVLVATSLDRHQMVCYPRTYRAHSSRRARTMVVFAWVLALVFCIPQATIFSYQQLSTTVHDCWASFARPWGERVYVTWYSLSVFIIPLLVLLVTYTRICGRIWCSEWSQNPGNARGISRARLDTVKQTIAIIIVYIVCTTPFICALLWACWDTEAYRSSLWTGSTLMMLTLFSNINCCVNPLILLAFNPALRQALCVVIGSCRKREEPQELNSTPENCDTIDECGECDKEDSPALIQDTLL